MGEQSTKRGEELLEKATLRLGSTKNSVCLHIPAYPYRSAGPVRPGSMRVLVLPDS